MTPEQALKECRAKIREISEQYTGSREDRLRLNSLRVIERRLAQEIERGV